MRDYGKAIDEMREQIAGLRAMIDLKNKIPERKEQSSENREPRPDCFHPSSAEERERVHAGRDMCADRRLSEMMAEIKGKGRERGLNRANNLFWDVCIGRKAVGMD